MTTIRVVAFRVERMLIPHSPPFFVLKEFIEKTQLPRTIAMHRSISPLLPLYHSVRR